MNASSIWPTFRARGRDLLDLARRLQQHPQPQALAGKVLGLLFLNPSLRTLASFQSAMMRLGGTAFVITPAREPGRWKRARARS
jgi:N-acetylornithine carbamoyltransferase